jgi:hypothetical protein
MTVTWDAKDWFVLLRGKQYGPYTYAGLVRAAARGIVDPKAAVWCVGWGEWCIARDVPGLFEQEPELVPDDQEEGFDVPEGDDRGKSTTTKKVATAMSAATKPVAGRGSLESASGDRAAATRMKRPSSWTRRRPSMFRRGRRPSPLRPSANRRAIVGACGSPFIPCSLFS